MLTSFVSVRRPRSVGETDTVLEVPKGNLAVDARRERNAVALLRAVTRHHDVEHLLDRDDLVLYHLVHAPLAGYVSRLALEKVEVLSRLERRLAVRYGAFEQGLEDGTIRNVRVSGCHRQPLRVKW